MSYPPQLIGSTGTAHLTEHMIGPLLIIDKISGQKIGKKEQLKNRKHNNQLDDNNFPECFAEGHAAKTITIECIYFLETLIHYRFAGIG
jgi:hypothetical protein